MEATVSYNNDVEKNLNDARDEKIYLFTKLTGLPHFEHTRPRLECILVQLPVRRIFLRYLQK